MILLVSLQEQLNGSDDLIVMTNKLINEISPYLQQHANNPVDWYPWSEKPFQIAKKYDKPVFLSIGYSSCHWCHVMEKESFSDHAIAEYMNSNFVSIKVDREERPDIDSIYMESLQALTGSGGWPASLFLTPDKIPFFAGTYFPPKDMHGHPSFKKILESVHEHYIHKKETINSIGTQLKKMLLTELEEDGLTSSDHVKNTLIQLTQSFDSTNGGFSNAPKFPQPHILEYLYYLKINYYRYQSLIPENQLDQMIIQSISKMSKGGIYDHIGGGFHRYTVDSNWQTPHFEKMLYDNALLSNIYSKFYEEYDQEWMKYISEDILGYLNKHMSNKFIGYYAAQDADSEGEEGKYYIWEFNELKDKLSNNDLKMATKVFSLSKKGNFENKNILTKGLVDIYENGGIQENVDEFNNLKAHLNNIRNKKEQPFTDKKIITSWNGMTITALIQNYFSSSKMEYLNQAINSTQYILNNTKNNNLIPRYIINDKPIYSPTLEDYAFFIESLLKLNQATLNYKWLEIAILLTNTVIDLYWDDKSGYMYESSKDAKDLFVRPKSLYDNPYTSSFSKMTEILYVLGSFLDNPNYLNIVQKIMNKMIPYIDKIPLHTLSWIKTLEKINYDQKYHLFIIHEDKDIDLVFNKLKINKIPNLIYFGKSNTIDTGYQVFKDKKSIDGIPTFYLCKSYSCDLPTNSFDDIKSQLKNAINNL